MAKQQAWPSAYRLIMLNADIHLPLPANTPQFCTKPIGKSIIAKNILPIEGAECTLVNWWHLVHV